MIIKRDMMFTPAGKKRTLHIYLPDSYSETEERYPVMYFFDGHNLYRDEDATYGKSWGLKKFLDQWEKPMIIVGIECGHEPGERLIEYCPYHIHGGFLGDIDGTGDATFRWITEELKPMIDREYRTYSFREATGIAGSSMGGLMSIYGVIRYNDCFSKAACLSSAVFSDGINLLSDLADTEISADTRVYLSWGTVEAGGTCEDPADDWKTYAAGKNLELQRAFLDKGANTRVYCQRNGNHCEADWEKQVPGFMNYLWLNR